VETKDRQLQTYVAQQKMWKEVVEVKEKDVKLTKKTNKTEKLVSINVH
jgi:hypothetical protein